MTIGGEIRMRRKALGLSTKELGKRAGIAASTVRNLECGVKELSAFTRLKIRTVLKDGERQVLRQAAEVMRVREELK